MTVTDYLSLSSQLIQSAQEAHASDPEKVFRILEEQLAQHQLLLTRFERNESEPHHQ